MENNLRNYGRLLSGVIVDGIRLDVVEKRMDTVHYAVECLVSHPEQKEVFILERDASPSHTDSIPVRSEDVCRSMQTARFRQTERSLVGFESDVLIERLSVFRKARDGVSREVRRPSSDRCGIWISHSSLCTLQRS